MPAAGIARLISTASAITSTPFSKGTTHVTENGAKYQQTLNREKSAERLKALREGLTDRYEDLWLTDTIVTGNRSLH